MKYSNLALLPFFILNTSACVSATVEVDITKTSELHLHSPVAVTVNNVPEVDDGTTADFSDQLNSLQKIGSLNLTVTNNSLSNQSGDFSFADHIQVKMVPTDGSMPEIFIVDYTLTPADHATNIVNIPILVDGSQLVSYFSHGQMKFNYSVQVGSIPGNTTVDISHSISLHVEASVDKSYKDL